MEKSRWGVNSDKINYVLKPITREKTIRNTKSRKRPNKITFQEKRVDSSSFTSSVRSTKEIGKGYKSTYDCKKYQLVPIISEIRKNRITELISGLKSMAVDIQEFITTEAEILKRHNTDILKNPNFKSKLTKLCTASEEVKEDIDSVLSFASLSCSKEDFDERLTQFLEITDSTKLKASKILFQVILVLEILINKMVSIEKFKCMHLISKLSLQGEDVNIYLEKYHVTNHFTGKGTSLYFELLNQLIALKSVPVVKVKKEEIKNPALHISGSFKDYIRQQVDCKITKEFSDYICSTFSQTQKDLMANQDEQAQTHQEEINSLTQKNMQLESKIKDLTSKIFKVDTQNSSLHQEISQLQSENQKGVFTLSQCDQKDDEIERLKSELQVCKFTIDSLNANIADLEQKTSEGYKTIQSLNSKIESLSQEIIQKDEEIATMKFKAASDKELERLKVMVNELRKENDSHIEQNTELRSSVIQINQKLSEKEKTLFEMVSRCNKSENKFKEFLKNNDPSQSINKSDYDALKDQLHQESAKCMTLESEIETYKENLKSSDMVKNLQKDEIKSLKNTLREFTSFKYDDLDDTYEAALKSEFDRMKVAFEARIRKLQSELESQRKEMSSKNIQNNKTILDLKDTVQRLTKRMTKLR
ncbi:unnamed protein product [Moneuplotes crassus]|uniref:Uncharacterized protein n=1 Tax=Euplotes crassus TaxID=5936 RepID=A0AAD1U6W4_EUPCR|nr:unnamed protein product [Moneuplotes crassus]